MFILRSWRIKRDVPELGFQKNDSVIVWLCAFGFSLPYIRYWHRKPRHGEWVAVYNSYLDAEDELLVGRVVARRKEPVPIVDGKASVNGELYPIWRPSAMPDPEPGESVVTFRKAYTVLVYPAESEVPIVIPVRSDGIVGTFGRIWRRRETKPLHA